MSSLICYDIDSTLEGLRYENLLLVGKATRNHPQPRDILAYLDNLPELEPALVVMHGPEGLCNGLNNGAELADRYKDK